MEIEIKNLFVGKCNVRKKVGDIAELTASIREKGMLEPIIVRPIRGRYELIIGLRRFNAAKSLKLKTIPAIVKEMDDAEAVASSLIENIHRGDIEPESEAIAYQKLINIYGSAGKVARIIGIDKSRIDRTKEILELVPELRKKVIRGASAIEREKAEAIPFEHSIMIAEAFRSEEVGRLSKEEKKEKQEEIAKIIAPLPKYEARKVIDYFKMYPKKPLEDVKEKALAKMTGIDLKTYLPPKTARELDKVAEEKGMAVKEIAPLIIEKGIESYKPKKEPTPIDEIATGLVIRCPRCNRKFRFIHCEPTKGHKLEEVST